MIEKKFRRKAIAPVLSLITGLCTGFTALLQLSMGSPAAFINLITCGLCLLNGIWGFASPFIIMDESIILIKYSIFKERVIYLSDIQNIDLSNRWHARIYYGNSNRKISYMSMSSYDKTDFIEALTEINQNYLTV